jgi:transcriptional regulator with XRE-family HTH domain
MARSHAAARIGRAVTELRQDAGCSLSELARRSGLGKATLSGVEAGNRNPTLDTLYAIATALGLPLVAILSAAGETRTSGAAVHALLVDTFATPAQTVEIYRLGIQPRDQRSLPHVPGTIETLTVIAGQAEVGPLDRLQRLGAGDVARYAADVPHRYRAIGAPATCVLVMSTPRTDRARAVSRPPGGAAGPPAR